MLKVPTFSGAESQADWAEMNCLFENRPLSREEIQKTLEENNIEDSDEVVEDIWQQIEWRHSKYPDSYPINAVAGRLEKDKSWRRVPAYAFMLLLTRHTFYKETTIRQKGNEWKATSKLFERVVTASMTGYLGNAADIGAPRQNGVPRSFGKCLDYISELTKEHRAPNDPLLPSRKDAGVDVISWRPLDARPGQVIVLVQCAAGETWAGKGKEIDIGEWKKLVNFAADPVKALAFPNVYKTSTVEDEDRWVAYSWTGGILLDRLRIANWFPSRIESSFRGQLVKWCKGQIDRLPKFA